MSDYKELFLEKSCAVDFLTHKAFIREKLQQGYTRHSIWKGLHHAKMISMTYSYFLRLCRSQLQEKLAPAPRKPAQSGPHLDDSRKEAASEKGLKAPASPSESTLGQDDSYMLGGFKIDPNRPKRASVEMPKPFNWNPIPLSEEEIRTGTITSR